MESLRNTALAQYTDTFQWQSTPKEYSSNIFSDDCRFSHYGRGRRIWEYLILFMSLIAPFEISFIYIVYPEITFAQYLPFFLVDLLFIADHRVIKRTIFISHGELIDDPEKIADLYGSVALWVHLISLIPLGWIGIVAKSSLAYLILSINKLLRLHRAFVAYQTTRKQLPYIGSLLTILPLFFFLFFSIHVFSCILLITARVEKLENSWLQNFVSDNYSSLKLYVIGIYFTLTTVSTIGYGDISPKTNSETITMIFVQVIGVFMHAFITSNMVYVFVNPLESDFINHYKVTQDYLRFKKIDDDKRKEVRNFCQYYWETTGAAGGVRNILKNLPKTLRTTIKLELTSKFFASTVSFSSLSPGQLEKVAKIIKHVTFSPGSFLAVQGEKCTCMLFVGKGIIQIIADGQVIASQSCTESTVHGENQMLLGSQCSTSIKALTYADAWVLYKDDLSNLLRTRGYIRNLVMQSIAVAFPVMIEDIARNMLGDMAPRMLSKLRANQGEIFTERVPKLRQSQQAHPRITQVAHSTSVPNNIEHEKVNNREEEEDYSYSSDDDYEGLGGKTNNDGYSLEEI